MWYWAKKRAVAINSCWHTGVTQLDWLFYCCHRVGQNIGTMGKRKEGKWQYSDRYDWYIRTNMTDRKTPYRLARYRHRMYGRGRNQGNEYNWYLKANRDLFTSRFKVLEKKIRAMS